MSLKVERGRTLARSQALQLLFQAEARDVPLDEVIEGDYLLSKGPLDPYAIELAQGCYRELDRIDDALSEVSREWKLHRMSSVDRNLLRIAVYEMRLLSGDDALEDAIVINEAVEIAKAYGTEESSRFVNGILGQLARMQGLPVREDVDLEFEATEVPGALDDTSSDEDSAEGDEPAADAPETPEVGE